MDRTKEKFAAVKTGYTKYRMMSDDKKLKLQWLDNIRRMGIDQSFI